MKKEKKSERPPQKKWWTRFKHGLAAVTALAVLVGGVAGVTVLKNNPAVEALTLPSGSSQIGTIGSAPVIQVSNNSFSAMQSLFDNLTGGIVPQYIAGDTQNGSGGEAIGWNSSTSYAGTTIANANSLVNGASGLTYTDIKVALETKDGFTDSDTFNYVGQGGKVDIHNVGTAYDTATGKNIPIGMQVTIDDATMYDSTTSQTPVDVFNGTGYKLLVAARNVNGNITLGYMVSMEGQPAPDGGLGSEGGGGGSGSTGGAAAGIPESVQTTVTLINENTGQPLPDDTLMAMKLSDVDAGQAFQLSTTSNVVGYIVGTPTNLSIQDNILTANGNNTVVADPNNLNPNSFIALVHTNNIPNIITDTNGNLQQGSIIGAYFGPYGSTSPRLTYGEFKVEKQDAQSGNTAQGNGLLQGAEYTIYDASTNQPVDMSADSVSSDHKITVTYGTLASDADGKLVIATGSDGAFGAKNLNVTKSYYALETKAPYGYTLSSAKLPISWTSSSPFDKDDNNFEDNDLKASDQVDSFAFMFAKVQDVNGSLTGLNGAEFTLTPQSGTAGNPIVVTSKTGTDSNGYTINGLAVFDGAANLAAGNKNPNGLAIGKYLLTETKTPAGLVAIDPTEIDVAPDPVTTGAPKTYTATFTDTKTKQVIDSLTVNQSDLKDNAIMFKVNLGQITDKPAPVPTPSIDVEKANGSEPAAGKGNNTDKDNNDGTNDHDTAATADELKPGETTPIFFRETNNGTEPLTEVTANDVTTDGKAKITNLVWKYKGQVLQMNDKGYFLDPTKTDGSLLILPVGDSIDGSATLQALEAGATTADTVKVTAVGTMSGKPVSDSDQWHGKTPKPSIDVEKANDAMPSAGNGNNTDKDNNAGANDHDTSSTAASLIAGQTTTIYFNLTNNGTESLKNVTASDVITDGKAKITHLVWTYNGKTLKTNASGYFLDPTKTDGTVLTLPVGASIKGTGTLEALENGATTADKVTVGGVGTLSGQKVGDSDKWYGTTKKSVVNIFLDTAGRPNLWVSSIGIAILATLAIWKRKVILRGLRKFRRKFRTS